MVNLVPFFKTLIILESILDPSRRFTETNTISVDCGAGNGLASEDLGGGEDNGEVVVVGFGEGGGVVASWALAGGSEAGFAWSGVPDG
jgi:hypothetical protein